MKINLPIAFTVSLTLAFAFVVSRASLADLPPSQDISHQNKTPYKSNGEDVSGQNSTNGRFQLLSGNSWLSANASATAVPVILKIDSQTGRTWMLVMMGGTNGANMGFLEVKDLTR